MPAPDAPRPTDPAKAPKPPPPAPARRPLLARVFWPVLCLVQLGVIAGGYYAFVLRPQQPTPTTQPAVEAAKEEKKPATEPAAPPALADLPRADNHVREGRYELALAVYRPVSANASGTLRDTLQYRVGLCLEGLGQWDQALAAYRTVASRTESPYAAAAAQLAQARVQMRLERAGEAKPLLYNLLLGSARPGVKDRPLLGDVRYLLALALTQDAAPPEKPGPLNDAVVPSSPSDWAVERFLDWAAPSKAEGPLVAPAEEVKVQRVGPHPEQALVRAVQRSATVLGLLDRLAELAGAKVQWSVAARQIVGDRGVEIAVEALPLLDVVRAVADPVGLAWKFDQGRLELTSEAEVPVAELPVRRRASARRALRDAVLAHPGHALTPSAYLELGNLEVADGRLPEAAAWYQRLVRETPRSPAGVEANYNLGLVLVRMGDLDNARTAFYRLVDRAPGHLLAPRAYLRVGRIALEAGTPEQAITPLRRAVTTGTGTPTQQAAVLHLAAAYLLAENPRAAAALLQEHRVAVGQPPFRGAAAFLDALARYRSATSDPALTTRLAPELLAGVLEAQGEPVLGVTGKFLQGQAYRELGMTGQMADVYEKALPAARGRTAAEMTYAVAETLYAGEKRREALKWYAALAKLDGGKYEAQAQYRLAEIALQERRPQDCVRRLRALLEAGAQVDQAAVLRLMGQAYEAMGEPRQAARCYAGQLPL